MVFCCGCCSKHDVADDDASDDKGSASRSLLRMRWGRVSPDEAKPFLLEGGFCFRFSGSRYTLCSEVGRGAHCVVWRCLRVSQAGSPRQFALKLHNEETSALKRESGALTALRQQLSNGDSELFPRMLGVVKVQGKMGLAMPLYGPDLYQLQKLRERKPFPTAFVWSLTTQLLHALEALHKCSLVHADIKPQNVVLNSASPSEDLNFDTRITLIDLGSCLTNEQLGAHSKRITYVQSRWYRAPEVLLWATIGNAADAWSVGCVIAEVAIGVPLLPGESEYNQLARITALLGPPPAGLLARSRRAEDFFMVDERRQEPVLRRTRAKDEPALIRYLPTDDFPTLLDHLLPCLSEFERHALLCLLDGLLCWDPMERWAGPQLMKRLHAELGAPPPGRNDFALDQDGLDSPTSSDSLSSSRRV